MNFDMEKQQQSACPMHPKIIKDAPGNCPKCGMTPVGPPGFGWHIKGTCLAKTMSIIQ
jgi:hypothetical protein